MNQLVVGLRLLLESKKPLWISSILGTIGLGLIILGITWPPAYVRGEETVLEAGKLPYVIQVNFPVSQGIAYGFILWGDILLALGLFSFLAWWIARVDSWRNRQ